MEKIDVLNLGYVNLVSTMGNDLEVANAARVSYDKRSELNDDSSLKKKDEKLIDFLWKEEHTSPFRHCVLSFEIYAPLMVARQHWKYAVASTFVDDQNGWNESSRRYITEEPAFYIPTAEMWRSAPENSKQGSGDPINYGLGIELTMRLFNMIEAAERTTPTPWRWEYVQNRPDFFFLHMECMCDIGGRLLFMELCTLHSREWPMTHR